MQNVFPALIRLFALSLCHSVALLNWPSLIEFISRCSELTVRGVLLVDVENIIFCSDLSSPSTPPSPSTNCVPKKHRKFGPRTAPHNFDIAEPITHASTPFRGCNIVSLSWAIDLPVLCLCYWHFLCRLTLSQHAVGNMSSPTPTWTSKILSRTLGEQTTDVKQFTGWWRYYAHLRYFCSNLAGAHFVANGMRNGFFQELTRSKVCTFCPLVKHKFLKVWAVCHVIETWIPRMIKVLYK